jgi:hypothetical protein
MFVKCFNEKKRKEEKNNSLLIRTYFFLFVGCISFLSSLIVDHIFRRGRELLISFDNLSNVKKKKKKKPFEEETEQ